MKAQNASLSISRAGPNVSRALKPPKGKALHHHSSSEPHANGPSGPQNVYFGGKLPDILALLCALWFDSPHY